MITLKKKKRSLWQRIKECFLIDKDKCFEENKNEKGICYGLYGWKFNPYTKENFGVEIFCEDPYSYDDDEDEDD